MMRRMRWLSIVLALLVGATIGGLIALAGAFGIQSRKDHRDDVQARRARQEAVMVESYRSSSRSGT